MLPEGKCRYIDGQIYPDGNFYVLDTQHIKHNGSELKSALNGISTDISNKVDKETGKGLSTNDYTTAEKNKLSGIEANANNYVHPTTSGNKHIPSGGSSGKILGWSADGTAAWVDPASGGSVDTVYIGSTEYAPDANGKVTLPTYPTTLPASDVYSWAKASTKPSYTASEVGAIATTSKGANNGVAELDSSGKVPSSQLPSYTVDSALSDSSTNPVQNMIITSALDKKITSDSYSASTDLNDLKSIGIYRTAQITAASQHAPETGYFVVMVFDYDVSSFQIAYNVNNPDRFFTRKYVSSAWSQWYKYAPYVPFSTEIATTQASDVDNLSAGTVTTAMGYSIAGYDIGTWAVIRTYDLNTAGSRRMQILEVNGDRKSRFKGSNGWGNWV